MPSALSRDYIVGFQHLLGAVKDVGLMTWRLGS